MLRPWDFETGDPLLRARSLTVTVLVGRSMKGQGSRGRRGAELLALRSGLVVLLCLLAFSGFMAAAMWLYPGGNWLDRRVIGHRFFANFLCDLTQPVSLSGVDNRLGARCAQLGMLCFAGALIGFFWLIPRHFVRESRLTAWVRGLGASAALIFLAVPVTPSQHFGRLHAWLALAAGALGILATLCTLFGLARSDRRARRLARLGVLALLAGAFDAGLFIYHLADVTPPPLIVPAAQKGAALLFCLWMVQVAWRGFGGRAVTRHP